MRGNSVFGGIVGASDGGVSFLFLFEVAFYLCLFAEQSWRVFSFIWYLRFGQGYVKYFN